MTTQEAIDEIRDLLLANAEPGNTMYHLLSDPYCEALKKALEIMRENEYAAAK